MFNLPRLYNLKISFSKNFFFIYLRRRERERMLLLGV